MIEGFDAHAAGRRRACPAHHVRMYEPQRRLRLCRRPDRHLPASVIGDHFLPSAVPLRGGGGVRRGIRKNRRHRCLRTAEWTWSAPGFQRNEGTIPRGAAQARRYRFRVSDRTVAVALLAAARRWGGRHFPGVRRLSRLPRFVDEWSQKPPPAHRQIVVVASAHRATSRMDEHQSSYHFDEPRVLCRRSNMRLTMGYAFSSGITSSTARVLRARRIHAPLRLPPRSMQGMSGRHEGLRAYVYGGPRKAAGWPGRLRATGHGVTSVRQTNTRPIRASAPGDPARTPGWPPCDRGVSLCRSLASVPEASRPAASRTRRR